LDEGINAYLLNSYSFRIMEENLEGK